MTLQPKAPHKRPRWLVLLAIVVTLTLVGAGIALATVVTDLAPGYAGGIQVDVHGANDVPGQVDVTQMGRDTHENPDLRIFWSWDSISAWTGSGQTGDACALFDNGDADAFINYVVCARVQNLNADPTDPELLPASLNHPAYIFDCSNKKDDRCTNPAPRTYTEGLVLAGPLGSTLTQSGAGNLVTETDPFTTGESYPKDTSIDLFIDRTLVPSGVYLANVCSYPSAGNGGNNNPFDCIVTPGVQYGTLVINKVLNNDNGGTKVVTDFSFKVNGGTAEAFEADGSNSKTVAVGTYSVVEDGLPISNYTTTYANGSNSNLDCTSLAVTVGATTTCTITNNDNAPALHLRKTVTNDNGGAAAATAWTLTATGTVASPTNLSGSTPVDSGTTFKADTYTLGESGPSGYTAGAWNCGTATMPTTTTVTVPFGGNVTCTINNDDNIATPEIATHMKWTLNDRSTMMGWRSGGGASTVTFTLYKDGGGLSSCEPSTQIASATETVAVNDTTGAAATVTGYTTEVAGTYHWIASFSGNSNNDDIATNCGDEVTTLP